LVLLVQGTTSNINIGFQEKSRLDMVARKFRLSLDMQETILSRKLLWPPLVSLKKPPNPIGLTFQNVFQNCLFFNQPYCQVTKPAIPTYYSCLNQGFIQK
jgi:hypothetical protein